MQHDNEPSSGCLRVATKASHIDQLELAWSPQAQPVPSAGQAVVRVAAAAVNPSDVKATLGIMPHAVFPRTPGRDFAGHVVAGPQAWLGQAVWGSGGDLGITRDGSHAAFLSLPVAALQPAPIGVPLAQAGAVGVPFVTALDGFGRACGPEGLQAGQTVVVFGANGKVGQAAVQLAARAGAKVIAVQRSASLVGHACAPVTVVNAKDFADSAQSLTSHLLALTNGRGADVVFNTVDRVYWDSAHAVMAKGAAQIFIIATKGETVPFDLFRFYRGMHRFFGIDTLALDCVRSCELLASVRSGFEDGSLQAFPVLPSHQVHLSDALGAYRRVLQGEPQRMVLLPSTTRPL